MTSPPTRIDTERLLLRSWTAADADDLRAALNESREQLVPWVPWATLAPVSCEQALERASGWQAQFLAGESFVYAVFALEGGGLVGGAGLYPRIGPAAIEIGYWIRSDQAGRGFATEASRALTAAGFRLPGIERIQMHCDPANLRSIRIPTKLGYRLAERKRRIPEGTGRFRDTDVFEMTSKAYQNIRREAPWDGPTQAGPP